MEEQNCRELFVLTIEQFAQVIELGIPLEALFVLECLIQGTDPSKHIKAARLAGINQTLTRKGYLSKEGVTPLGSKTYTSLLCGGMGIKEVVKQVHAESMTKFDEWWKIFPTHDGFDKWEQTRTLRIRKEACLKLFTDAVVKGIHTPEQIIQGTQNHLDAYKRQSLKERTNKFKFLHNSETYLRQKDYEIWIDLQAPTVAHPINTTIDL